MSPPSSRAAFAWTITVVLFTGLTMLGFQNCGRLVPVSFRTQSSEGLAANAYIKNGRLLGKALPADFALASDSKFNFLNADVTPGALIYVDADAGSDLNAGDARAPLATIAAAQTRARGSSARGESVVVVLRGEFDLAATWALTRDDSGAAGQYVVYVGDPGKPASITGLTTLAGTWTQVDAVRNIYALPVAGHAFRKLFVNGQAARRARSAVPLLSATLNATNGIDCAACGLSPVAGPTPIEVVLSAQWQSHHCPATLASDAGITINPTCANFARNMNVPIRAVTALEDAVALINGPGQWALDRAAGRLYYAPRAGESIANARVQAGELTELITLTGVSNLALVNIRFTGNGWERPSTDAGFVDLQADVMGGGTEWIPAAVRCEACAGVIIMDSEFADLATSALRVGQASRGALVFHNSFHDVDASAIQIGDYSADDPARTVGNVVVEDNVITRVGADFLSSPGIFHWFAVASILRHNTLTDLPYTGISVGWGWTQSAVPNLHDNVVAANHVGNITKVLQDGGGVYMNAAQAGSRVEHNFVHDVLPGVSGIHSDIFGIGVYLDNGCQGITVNNNSALNVVSRALFLQDIVPPFAINNVVQSDGVDELTIRREAGARVPPIPPLKPGERLGFGGMYGLGGGVSYPNPLTGAGTCPAGYAPAQVLGTTSLDWPLYYCYKVLAAGEAPGWDFGGAYGGGSSPYPNPATGAASCPAGYTSTQVYGTTSLDWPVWTCWRPHAAGARDFHGMYGFGYEGPKPLSYVHPLTGGLSCPAGSTATNVFGTTSLDWPVVVCF